MLLKNASKNGERPLLWLQAFIVAITLTVVAVAILLSRQTYRETKKMATEQFNRQQLTLARSAAIGIEVCLEEIGEELPVLAKMPDVRAMTPECLTQMQLVYGEESRKASIRRLDEDGILRFIYPNEDWRGELIGQDYGEETFFIEARETGEHAVSGLVINEIGELRIRAAYPVFIEDGKGAREFAGVVVASFDIEELDRLYISPIVSGETGYAWLLNQDSIFVAHHDEGFVGRNAFEVRAERNPDISYEAVEQIQRQMLAGEEGMGRYVSGWHQGQREETEKLVAYTPVHIDDVVWSVAVCAPVSEVEGIIHETYRSELYTLGFVTLALMACGIGLLIVSYRWSYSLEQEVARRTKELRETITERKRAEEALRRRAKELAALQATVLDITAPYSLPALLQTIVERAARLLNALGGGLYLCDPDRKQVRCVASHNTPRDFTGIVLEYGEGAAGVVAQTGEPLIIDDYRTWDKRAAVYEEEQPFTTILSAPMIWQGQVTGVIHVLQDVESRRFTPADLELLTLFANHAAVAVENARLYEQSQEEIAERKQAEQVLEHRLLVLSQPVGKVDDLSLTDTIDIKVLQELQDGFAESYDVACLIFDGKGEAITRPSNFSDFCKIIRATKRGMEKCGISDANLARLVADGSSALAACGNFEEIQDGAVPILIGDKLVATWGIGQKVTSELDEDKVRGYAEEIGAHPDQLVAAAKKLEVGSKEQFERAVAFLETVASNISLLGLQNIQQAREITERKRVEETLRESEERLRLVVQNMPVMLDAFDADRNIIAWNRECERVTGYSAEEMIGNPKALELLYDTDYIQRTLAEWTEHGDDFRDWEIELASKDGSVNTVSWTNMAERFPIPGWASWSIGVDITERKRAEAKLMRLSTAISISTDSVVLTDIEGKIVEVNEATLKMYGADDEGDLIGKSAFDLLVPEEREKLFACMAELLEKGYVKRLEYYATTKSGGTRPMETSIALLRDVEGKPAGLVGITRDITERKRAEEERARLMAQIQEQAQQMLQIMDTVPEGMLLLDDDGQVILANPVAEKYLGVLAGARVGDTLTHLGDRPLEELLTSPPKGLWHEVAADGRRFEVIARPLETGPEAGDWVLVIRDVTQEREIQQRIQQQERLATVGQLAAGIAHDFNNIMATIVLYAQMSAQAEGLSVRERERLATIDQQAKHATNLIRQILDFGRRAVLERRPLDLSPLLKEQVRLLERTLPENIQIGLTYGWDEYTVNADPTRVQQVMMNLALNARDAMPEGGNLHFGLEWIQIQPRESPPLPEMEAGEWVQVTVSDTGMGIPPDVLPHIFDPFFTTKAPGKGSGLGLAQVHGIVKQHGGEIDVESPSTGQHGELVEPSGQAPSTTLETGQVGQGTTFTIYLPALPAHPPEPLTLELPALVKGQGETVLVVEDNTTTRQALVESLELLNYRVLEAANGREALAILEQRGDDIALVLSDVVMPEMGGVELLQALRQKGLAVKVVLMSGHPMEKEIEVMQAQGMSDWLPKPPRLEQLAQVLARALNL